MKNVSGKFNAFLQRTGGFLKRRGIYLVLITCLAAAGVAAFFAFGTERGAEDGVEDAPARASQDEPLAAAKTPEPTVQTPQPTATPPADFTPRPGTPSPTEGRDIPPVDGEVIWPFAADELIYSATLAQWMTHRGIDIAAKLGEPVYAPFAGVVDAVYEDAALGWCVRLAHPDNKVTIYANLAADPPVQEGQTVALRGVVGYVGETALAECESRTHLHFELFIDEEAVDPVLYFLLEH